MRIKTFISIILLNISIVLSSGVCKEDKDCVNYMNSCINNECRHKDLFPMTFSEGLAILLITMLALLANITGKGVLFMSIITVLMGFDIKEGIPLSKILLFAGTCSSFIYSALFTVHPERKRGPAFDVTLITFMIPFLAIGNQIGILLGALSPQIIIIILLTILLITSCVMTIKSAIKKYKSETAKIKKADNLIIPVNPNHNNCNCKVTNNNNINIVININNTNNIITGGGNLTNKSSDFQEYKDVINNEVNKCFGEELKNRNENNVKKNSEENLVENEDKDDIDNHDKMQGDANKESKENPINTVNKPEDLEIAEVGKIKKSVNDSDDEK